MGQSEYNEAQFEIEKAEAVKEARNAALEDAAKMFDSDAETATRLLAFNPDFCLVVKGIATRSAVRIRELKTLAILLLPLLFVFGSVCAGEDAKGQSDAPKAKDAPRVAGNASGVASRDAMDAAIARTRDALSQYRAACAQKKPLSERSRLSDIYKKCVAECAVLAAERGLPFTVEPN